VLDTNRLGGATFGVPWYVNTRLQYVRTDLLARAGYDALTSDWAGWKSALQALKRVAGAGNCVILLPVNEFEQLLAFGLQGDEPLLRDNGTRGGRGGQPEIAELDQRQATAIVDHAHMFVGMATTAVAPEPGIARQSGDQIVALALPQFLRPDDIGQRPPYRRDRDERASLPRALGLLVDRQANVEAHHPLTIGLRQRGGRQLAQ